VPASAAKTVIMAAIALRAFVISSPDPRFLACAAVGVWQKLHRLAVFGNGSGWVC
jgi:hypothetical protein